MLDLVFKNDTSGKSPGKKFFEEIFNAGVSELELNPVRSREGSQRAFASNGIKDKNVEVSLSLVGETKIKDLNKKYRNKNEITDVLSFPLEEARLKKYGILPLGDIFICLPFAVKEAKRQDISLKKELARLTVHGFLHLLGYDHEKSKQSAKKMFELETRILSKVKFNI